MTSQRERKIESENAVKYLNRLFSQIPNDATFNVSSLILESNFSESDKIIANDISQLIELLLRKYEYVKENNAEHFWYTLSDKGIKAKRYGGHTEFQNELNEIENLSKKKMISDLKNSLRINSTYWWTFSFSILALLLALGKIVYDIYKK